MERRENVVAFAFLASSSSCILYVVYKDKFVVVSVMVATTRNIFIRNTFTFNILSLTKTHKQKDISTLLVWFSKKLNKSTKDLENNDAKHQTSNDQTFVP